ncbi:MAG: hypothetical protein EXR27_17175 [Betaproteobacteria bacterium]|nr:hypothetical protein [Betaproteobacteria bacterium]
MAAPAIAAGLVGGPVLSVMAQAIKALYGIAGGIGDYLEKHVEEMKRSENHTISRTGDVLQMAKMGFGIGYTTPIVVIATGQMLLGNTFAAIGTVAGGLTLTNPIAMTCAAIGAVYYGWGALSESERNKMLEVLAKGLEVGIELIKSIVRFVIDKTKDLLSSKNIEELKKFVAGAAAGFGKAIGDVTHKVTDIVGDGYKSVKKRSGQAMEMTIGAASGAFGSVAATASDTYNTVANSAGKTADGIKKKFAKSTPNGQEKKPNNNDK